MGIKKQLMLVLQKWFLSFLGFLQPQSILKDVECTDMHSRLMAGNYSSDLLFAVDHHGQLLVSPVFVSSNTVVLSV
jgi:hypothetical protein